MHKAATNVITLLQIAVCLYMCVCVLVHVRALGQEERA